MLTRLDKQKIESLSFLGCVANTQTASGKNAHIYKNDTNINKPYFQLIVEEKTIFTRGTIKKVIEKLSEL